MNRAELAEAAGLVRFIVNLLLTVPVDTATPEAAQLRAACGAADADAEADLREYSFAGPLASCFVAVAAAGADADAMARVLSTIAQRPAESALADIVSTLAVRLALAYQCKAIAAMEIISRDQADALIARVGSAFDAAIDKAVDNRESDVFKDVSALSAAVVRDLSDRGRKLPQTISYGLNQRKPSLVLAQVLYADPSRGDELARNNGVIHPLFMPASVTALAF
jgi:prophage DNA circulation protein